MSSLCLETGILHISYQALQFKAGPVLTFYTPCSFTSATGPLFFPNVSAFFDFLFLSVDVLTGILSLTGEGKSLISKVENQSNL